MRSAPTGAGRPSSGRPDLMTPRVIVATPLIHTAMKTQTKMALLSLIVMDRWAMAEVCQIAAKP
jgi:hypothetical protein